MDDKKEHYYALKQKKAVFTFFFFILFTSFVLETLQHNIFLKYQYESLQWEVEWEGTVGSGKCGVPGNRP